MFYMRSEDIKLRDYQRRMVDLARVSISKHKKIILQASCGAGKTVISSYLLKQASEKGLRSAFICDRISLIDQTSKVFAKYGIHHGIIQGNHPLTNPYESVQVCSIQTLSRRKFEPFDFVIIDEVHTLFSKHREILDDTPYAVGLSATPWTKGLGNYFNDLVNPVTTRYLIDKGHLCDFITYGPGTIDMTGAKVRAGDYAKEELEERSDTKKIVGDIVKHWLKHGQNRKTIAFCVNTGHANHIEREFIRAGVAAKSINCYMKMNKESNEVREALKDFADGKIKVLCSVDMVSKGFDQPDVDCLILARPTKSKMVFVQQVGRGLRVGGAKECLILDHAGNTERLGFVDEIEINELDKSEKKRGRKKKKERDEPLPKPCPSCDFLRPAKVHKCPACGFEPENIVEIETVESDLKELKREKKTTIEDKKTFFYMLNYIAAQRGYNQGWASHKYREKFGVWPSNKFSRSAKIEPDKEVKDYLIYLQIKHAKKPPPLTCKYCGGKPVGSVVSNMHKYQYKCSACGRHLKWGK